MFGIIKELFKYTITFVGLIIVFNFLLYAVSLFPSELIHDNVLKTAEIMVDQGNIINTGFFAVVDNGIDAIVVNEAYSIDNETPVESYMLARKNYKKGQTRINLKDEYGQLISFSEDNVNGDVKYLAPKELLNFVNGNVHISQSYTRYYHGYLVLMRPLLLLFNVNGIRILMLLIYLVLLCIFAKLMKNKFGTKNTIIFTVLLITFGYTGIAQSLQSGPLFLIIMLSLIFLLANIEKFNRQYLTYYLFIIGAIANFVDFLTIPALSLFLPLAIVFIYNNTNKNILDLKKESYVKDFIQIFAFGISWSLGYILTWASKVLLVNFLFDSNGISSAISQVGFRIGGEIDDYSVRIWTSILIGGAIVINSFVIEILTLILLKSFKKNDFDRELVDDNSNLVLVSLIPLAWMFLLYNHTIYHFALFTYRNLFGIILCVSLFMFGDFPMRKIKKKKKA